MSKTMKPHDINIWDDFLSDDPDEEAEEFIKVIINQVEILMRPITSAADKRLLKKWKQHLESHIKRIETQLADEGGGD